MSFEFGQLRRHLQDEGIDFACNARAESSDTRRFDSLVYDSRQVEPTSMFCAVQGERAHGRDYIDSAVANGAAGLLVEGSSLSDLAGAADTVPALVTVDARAALAAAARGHLRESGARVVAITGSNGKTTTKDFTVAALSTGQRVGGSRGNLNSSWGLPAAVLASAADLDVLVLEMGASAPDEIDALCDIANPSVGVITNVAPAHLEFFSSEEEVARTKAAVVRRLDSDGVAVLPRDDRFYRYFCGQSGAERVLSFGTNDEATIRVEDVVTFDAGLRVCIAGARADLPVFSTVNATNAAAAMAVATVFGVSMATALNSIAGVSLSPHRSRILPCREGFVLDDSYNANPASMRAALEGLAARAGAGRRLAVLGRMAELGEVAEDAHREILEFAANLDIARIFVIGDEFASAASSLADPKVKVAENLLDLKQLAMMDARDRDCWLVKGSRSVGLERVVEALVGGGAERSSKGEVA